MISDKRLYLTKDKRVVEHGDPLAHELLVGAGCEIEPELAAKYGLDGKQVKPPENKARKPGENK